MDAFEGAEEVRVGLGGVGFEGQAHERGVGEPREVPDGYFVEDLLHEGVQ